MKRGLVKFLLVAALLGGGLVAMFANDLGVAAAAAETNDLTVTNENDKAVQPTDGVYTLSKSGEYTVTGSTTAESIVVSGEGVNVNLTMTVINRVLCRLPQDENSLLDGMTVWPDNAPGEWYYLAVQEATNSHEFTAGNEIYEAWVALTDAPDWTRYQEEN